METLNAWAEEFAAEVVPNEIDLASSIAQAYTKGGKTRRELLQAKTTGGAGGMGAGEVLLLGHVFHALVSTSTLLYGALASGALTNLVILVKGIIELREKAGEKSDQQANKKTKNKEEPAQRLTREIPVSPENQLLLQSIAALSDALKSSGLSQDKRDLLAYRSFLKLAQDPSKSKTVLENLGKNK